MEVQKIIIHNIESNNQDGNFQLTTSDHSLAINNNVNLLVDRLNNSFKNQVKVVWTEFLEEERDFQRTVNLYMKDNSNQQFYDFSTIPTARLLDLINSKSNSKGGYYVYVDYIYRKSHYLAVFVVRDEKGIAFNRNDGMYSIETPTVIDTNKLTMSCRINLTRKGNNLDRYLNFARTRKDVPEYFTDWIEASLAEKSAEDTNNLILLIDKLDKLPIDPDTNEEYDSTKFRSKVCDYIRSNGRVVKVRTLSRAFWNDEGYLTDQAEKLEIILNEEFQAVNSVLNKLKKYEAKSGNLKVSFSKADYDSKRVSIVSDKVILKDQALIRKLKEQIGAV